MLAQAVLDYFCHC